jgi:uncharacterized repeat protein (TIGR02543 family)
MDSDKSITANFVSVPTYTLSANATTGGSISIYPEGGVYNEGTRVTITAKAELGYVFGGWSGDLAGSDNPAEITMDSDKNVTATFSSVPVYTLTTNATGGTITLDPPGPRYNEGTKVKLRATAKPGYEFTNWSGDALDFSAKINPNRVTMDSDKNITAEFIGNPETLNLIQNGDFSEGLDFWSPQVISPAQATISVENEECKIEIQTASSEEWHVNILQQQIPLESNVSYTLSFDARATADKFVSAKAQFDHDPWTSSLQKPVKITTTMQRYNVTWLQEKATASYKVGLFFGSDTADVWVDNFELLAPNTSVQNQQEIKLPQQTQLGQNYPNPFNPETTIPYQLNESSHVRLEIHNFLGQHVITLVNEPQPPGHHLVNWNGNDSNGNIMASGIYIYRLATNDNVIQTKKFILTK